MMTMMMDVFCKRSDAPSEYDDDDNNDEKMTRMMRIITEQV